MRKSLLVMGTLTILKTSACGNSSKSAASTTPSGASNQPAAGGASTASLIAACISDYLADDFGAIGNNDGSADPSPYCNCVIPSWLSAGDSAQKIADAIKTAATDSGGVAPIGFDQQTACISKNPTINPNTGAPW